MFSCLASFARFRPKFKRLALSNGHLKLYSSLCFIEIDHVILNLRLCRLTIQPSWELGDVLSWKPCAKGWLPCRGYATPSILSSISTVAKPKPSRRSLEHAPPIPDESSSLIAPLCRSAAIVTLCPIVLFCVPSSWSAYQLYLKVLFLVAEGIVAAVRRARTKLKSLRHSCSGLPSSLLAAVRKASLESKLSPTSPSAVSQHP